MEDWSQYIEDDESWDTIYLDFSKAFDSVAHKRLLHKAVFNLEGAMRPLALFSIKWPLVTARVGHLLHCLNREILGSILFKSEIK